MAAQTQTWVILAHLSQLLAFATGLFGWLGPLVIWLIKKDQDPIVAAHAKEALNFQLSLLVYAVVSLVLMLVLVGFLTLVVVGVLALVFPIIAAVQGSNGVFWRYPLTIRFIS